MSEKSSREIVRENVGAKTYDSYIEFVSLLNRLADRDIGIQEACDLISANAILTQHLLAELVKANQKIEILTDTVASHKS